MADGTAVSPARGRLMAMMAMGMAAAGELSEEASGPESSATIPPRATLATRLIVTMVGALRECAPRRHG